MKRILSAALALTLLSGTAAVAAPHDRGGYDGGYARDYNDDRDGYRDHRSNDGAAVAVGLGIFALAILAASNSHRHDGYYGHDRGYRRGHDGYYYGRGHR